MLGFPSPSREVGCTSALSECRKVTAWQLAAQLLCQIDVLALQPDAVTYAAGVSCYGRAAQWERALALFHRAQQQIQRLDSRLGSGSGPSSNDGILYLYIIHMSFRPTSSSSQMMKRMPYERRRPLTDPLAAVRSMIWQRVIQSKDVKMINSCLQMFLPPFTQPVLPMSQSASIHMQGPIGSFAMRPSVRVRRGASGK